MSFHVLKSLPNCKISSTSLNVSFSILIITLSSTSLNDISFSTLVIKFALSPHNGGNWRSIISALISNCSLTLKLAIVPEAHITLILARHYGRHDCNPCYSKCKFSRAPKDFSTVLARLDCTVTCECTVGTWGHDCGNLRPCALGIQNNDIPNFQIASGTYWRSDCRNCPRALGFKPFRDIRSRFSRRPQLLPIITFALLNERTVLEQVHMLENLMHMGEVHEHGLRWCRTGDLLRPIRTIRWTMDYGLWSFWGRFTERDHFLEFLHSETALAQKVSTCI